MPTCPPPARVRERTTELTRDGARWLRAHSRTLSITALLALGGLSATAFGIAPMAPDAADLPRRLVQEELAPTELDAQLESLAAHGLSLFRSDVTRSGDTPDALFSRLGVVDAEASAFFRNDETARRLFAGRPGKLVQVRKDAQGRVEQLVARGPAEETGRADTHFSRLTVLRDAARAGPPFSVDSADVPLSRETRLGSGTIRHTLFAAADESRIPDAVAVQVAEMFANDIDFRRDLRKGDTFSVLYEALLADGEPVPWQTAGRVLAAEFVNGGTTHSAVWFEVDGHGAYYDLSGQSKRRSFLSSPLEFSRVTSGFALRFHPIHKTWRQHNGVDYGAPTGTPVRSVGDAVVAFAGVQGGYGNVVELRHDKERTTVYAHLDRVDVRTGDKVHQGQHIGTVGSTGWATGPHLHFEVKIRGEHQDPLLVAKGSEAQFIAPQRRGDFERLARGVRAQLDSAYRVASRTHYVE